MLKTAIVALGLLLSSVQVVARPIYPQPVIYPHPDANTDGFGVATADMNGDDVLDLVMVLREGSPDVLSVALGNGDGTFVLHFVYDFEGAGPGRPALGDFNEDGIVDVATNRWYDNSVSVLLGVGDGTLDPHVVYGMSGSTTPKHVDVGDFDGDDHQDLLVIGLNTELLLGRGDGSFEPSAIVGPGQGISVLASGAVADFNDDNRDDYTLEGRVFISDGDGTFSEFDPLESGLRPCFNAAGDLNRDSLMDIVVNACPSGQMAQIQVHLGQGDGHFLAPQVYPLSAPSEQDGYVAVRDVDADGWDDVVVSNWWSFEGGKAISVFYGTGGGQLGPEVRFGNRPFIPDMAFGDFDEDGIEDLAMSHFFGGIVSILFGDGRGGYVDDERFDVGGLPVSITVADLDGDGRPDVVTANETTNDLSVLLAEGAGTFEPEVRYAAGTLPAWVTSAELTGDSHPDLAAVSVGPPAEVTLLQGVGDGSFASIGSPSLAPGVSPNFVTVADLDDDGNQDLIVTDTASSEILVFPGNGDGTFDPATNVTVGAGPRWVGVGDLDDDDVLDLAVALEGDTMVRILLGVGDGTFQLGQSLRPLFPPGPIPTSLAIGDVNGDLVPDVVVSAAEVRSSSVGLRYDRVVYGYLGIGDGSFQLGEKYPLLEKLYTSGNLRTSQILIEDVDGDARTDLVLAYSEIDVWLGDEAGGLGAPRSFNGVGSDRSIATSDFNLDGRPDVVSVAGRLFMKLNQTGPRALTILGDGETLVWPAVTGALSYDVYRGNLAELVDLDDDGLPDAGYGDCISGLDGDTRDTFFVDSATPSPEGAGFFYLLSVIDAGGDQGLGTTSEGLPRVPETPCP